MSRWLQNSTDDNLEVSPIFYLLFYDEFRWDLITYSDQGRRSTEVVGPERVQGFASLSDMAVSISSSLISTNKLSRRLFPTISFPSPFYSLKTMCPLVRTPNSCCVNKAIQHLSFDPSLQDSAWHRAQARPKPYHTADRDKCLRKTDKGEFVCDASVLDVLDTLGVSLDPTSRTVATKSKQQQQQQYPKRDSSPNTDRLAHKSLYIPGNQSKVRPICFAFPSLLTFSVYRVQCLAPTI